MTFQETIFYAMLYAYVAVGFGYMARKVKDQFVKFA